MPYLTQLAAVARRTGYPVTEVSGWKTRGHGPQPNVFGIVCHHTGGMGDRGVVVNGRPDLDGPLSQFWLEHTGRIHVVAAGRCWHNAPSTSSYHNNSNSIGIEAENPGRGQWPAVQVDAYKKLVAELCKEFDLSANRVKGHKEVNTQKDDPKGINMDDFRKAVAAIMSGNWMEAMVRKLPTLDKGDTGEDVQTCQALLVARSHPVKMTGVFDDATIAGVKAVQRWGKVDDDGIVGPITWSVLLRVN